MAAVSCSSSALALLALLFINCCNCYCQMSMRPSFLQCVSNSGRHVWQACQPSFEAPCAVLAVCWCQGRGLWHLVAAGDIIIMGSDGLLDNMSEMEMVEEVQRLLAAGAHPSTMAQQIAKVAFDHSLDKHGVTPYSRAATEAFDMVYSGGKPDDITVLVAVVSGQRD